MKATDVLLLAVVLLAALFFVGGVIDVFRVPVPRRRRSNRSGLTELLNGLLEAESLPRQRGEETLHLAPAPLEASPEHAGAGIGPPDTQTGGPQELTEAVATLDSRSWIFVASTVSIAVILGMFLLRGGGNMSLQPPEPSDPRRQAEALAAKGDYKGAWQLYYQALQGVPEDVSLWYGLGVALSHLNQRKETEQAFQYVVRHGRPDSEEVRRARRWLVSTGVLGERVAFTASPKPVAGVRGHTATVKGKVTWGASESNRRPVTVGLLLAGLSGAGEGKRFHARAGLGGSYRFERLPPGTYRLIGATAGQHVWDVTLTVEDGREVVLDLGEDNSKNPAVGLPRAPEF